MVATDRQTDRQTDRHAKNNFFRFSGPQNVNIHQNLEVDFLGKCNTFSILRIAEKVKTQRGSSKEQTSVQSRDQSENEGNGTCTPSGGENWVHSV